MARARARRACRAACSALRLSRRAAACWRPRRSCCASPRRAAICARARSSCISFHHGLVSVLVSGSRKCFPVMDGSTGRHARPVPAAEAAACSFLRGRPAAACGGSPLLGGTALRPRRPRAHAAPGRREAEVPHRAVLAQRLGELDVGGRLGEPQLRVVDPARQQLVVAPGRPVVELTERRRQRSAVPSVRSRTLMVMSFTSLCDLIAVGGKSACGNQKGRGSRCRVPRPGGCRCC